jgi:Fic family protein
MDVRNEGKYEAWVAFFLKGIIESAKDSIACIDLLLELHKTNFNIINEKVGRSLKTVNALFLLLESTPIIDIKSASVKIGVTFKTCSSAINVLRSLGILEEVSNQERYQIFAYEEYLKILRKGTELK